jgi:hypothetical protein
VAIKFEKLREMAYIYFTAMQVAWLTRECMRGERRGADAVYPHREARLTQTPLPSARLTTSSLGLTLRRPTIFILILVPFLVLPIVFITLAKLREKYLVKEARTRRMVTHFG